MAHLPHEGFWMVWREGSEAPTLRHTTEQSARAEAERLVRLYSGHRFYVLAAIAVVRKSDVEWSDVPSRAAGAPF